MSDVAPPPLREDLRIRKSIHQGEVTYILKDPDEGAYYRFDAAQHLMLTLFDGKRTPEELVERFNATSAEFEFDLEAVQDLIDSARENKLLKRNRKEENAALVEKLKAERKGRFLQAKGSLLMVRFHLVDPNQAFERIIHRIRWIWTPAGVKASFVLIGIAVLAALSQGTRFIDDFERVFHFQTEGGMNFFKIWLVALGAIAFHELAHGLTCKNYGGDVNDMGFLLLAFQPCLYCNVNDAWMFENNRHKIYTALSGVWIELVLSAFAVFVWLMTDVDNPVGRTAFVLITISTASSLFLNLNPLMKYDGYYILSDLLQVPNLRQNAIDWFSHILKTRVLRIEDEAPLHPTRRERRTYLLYGGLTVGYLTLMMSTLGFMVYGMVADSYGTLGIVLFLTLALKLARMMTGTWGKTMKEWSAALMFGSQRRKIITGLAALPILALLVFWHPRVSIVTEGQVDAELLKVHAPESGFLDQVGYRPDRTLTGGPGALLARLRSPELELELVRMESRRQGLGVDRTLAASTGDRSLMQRNQLESHAVEEELASLHKRMQRLELRVPPGSWRVNGPPPVNLEGRHFGAGQEILTLAPTRQRHVNVELAQSDLDLVEQGNRALIRMTGSAPRVFEGEVIRITPVAKVEGPNRLFQVRVRMVIPEDLPPPPLEATAEVKIFGDEAPLWEHLILRPIRHSLRVDLWI
ncbi:MAG: HlyD family efflux transporter periplasmic adaptor subunit [Magnetococcales bacterium]|nr:HlyD family efflux transporter periplasmic adaptor subunit [Magnetococcales bacterium]